MSLCQRPPMGQLDRPLSIVVLLGGWSTEREVSTSSGHAVMEALRSRGHDVRELDPSQIDMLHYPWTGVDVALIALHGSFGEDGTVQSWLEELGMPFTGSGVASSRLAMSKSATKQRFRNTQLPTPNYCTSDDREPEPSVLRKARGIGYPLVVKPDTQGSSIGVTIVYEERQLRAALARAFRYDPQAVLEQFIPGRELTVGLLDGWTLPVIEIRPAKPFFDFEAKYQDRATRYILEPDVPRQLLARTSQIAAAAASALGTKGLARVDLRLDPGGQPWLLEVNTVPGLTEHSLVPMAAAWAGIGMPDLSEWMVASALGPLVSTHLGERAA